MAYQPYLRSLFQESVTYVCVCVFDPLFQGNVNVWTGPHGLSCVCGWVCHPSVRFGAAQSEISHMTRCAYRIGVCLAPGLCVSAVKGVSWQVGGR